MIVFEILPPPLPPHHELKSMNHRGSCAHLITRRSPKLSQAGGRCLEGGRGESNANGLQMVQGEYL